MRLRLLAAALIALAAGACSPELSIGQERRLSLATAVPFGDGRWRQAGWIVSADGGVAEAQRWYGVASADGTVDPQISGPGSSVTTSVHLDELWVLGGVVRGEDGAPSPWLQALAADGGIAWTLTLPKTAGSASRVTALTRTLERTVFVAGLETLGDGSAGWAAKVDAQGAVVWRRAFETDFQNQVRGFRPYAVAAPLPPTTPDHPQIYLAGERTQAGATHPHAVMMTLSGDMWASTNLGDAGVAHGLAMDTLTPMFCVEDGTRPRAMWVQQTSFSDLGTAEATLDGEAAHVVGCAMTPTALVLGGAVTRGGAPVPFLLEVARTTRTVRAVKELAGAGQVSVLGLTLDGSAAPTLLGRTEPLHRRFWAGGASFTAR